jgi:Uma2 family endonuclease
MTVALTKPVKSEQYEVVYPDSDGEPMAETGIHVRTILHLYGALLNHYRRREDVYIAADMFLYYEKGNPKARKTPDVMVIHGVSNAPERRSFRVWEEGAVPSVVFEISSKATWMEDLVTKSVLYARLGVKEYFIFDPLEEYLEETLQGFRLEDKDYVPMDVVEGQLFSRELGLEMRREETILRLVDPATGEKVLSSLDFPAKVDELEEKARTAQQIAAVESQRAAVAEAENLRLRELLATYQSKGTDS